ncbi:MULTISPECIES: spore maturation protein B [Coprobacillaceae]|uniref:spore maturation protein B n=1 Tax=Coprobacillaceae TaxID=2810280 RepID=UPI000E4C3C37|nr:MULTISPECIES: spore maturation protein B [Coprobacillaceae]RHM59769.1 spore maturation protein B [Coprobacillus sp. AF33-1AC]RHS96087.1 spore maturation protein B [Erysipelatoclostridium sp. AM42-17]
MINLVVGFILVSFILGMINGVDVFDEFVKGVKEGLGLVVVLAPTLMAFTLWCQCFQTCGLLELLQQGLKPMMKSMHLPIQILMMMLIRPFSSQGSLVILNQIFQTYGINHLYSTLGSIIQTGSDTTFYVVTLYFASVKLKQYRYALKLGLFLDFLACLLALFCYFIFIVKS